MKATAAAALRVGKVSVLFWYRPRVRADIAVCLGTAIHRAPHLAVLHTPVPFVGDGDLAG